MLEGDEIMSWDTAALLDRLLDPLTPGDFFAAHWNRRALHLRGRPDKFAGLMTEDELLDALPRCQTLKAAFRDKEGWTLELPALPQQVKRLYEAGMTICAGVLPAEGARADFVRSYRRRIAWPGAVYFNCYYSPDGGGFGLHHDDHPVWVLQLAGRKRWWYSETAGVPEHMSSFSFAPGRSRMALPQGTVDRPDESTLTHVELEPGDLLYLPARAWHRAQAVGHSFALTLSSIPARPLDLVRLAVGGMVKDQPALLRELEGVDAATLENGGMPPELAARLHETREALAGAVAGLTDADLLAAWRSLTEATPTAG